MEVFLAAQHLPWNCSLTARWSLSPDISFFNQMLFFPL